MKAVSRWLDRFCYNHPNFGVPNLMKYIALGNVGVFLVDIVTQGYATAFLSFIPSAILHGQIWRLFTFLFVPINSFNPHDMLSLLWFAMTTMFYYYIGNALERQWGSTRFTVFYALGAVLNILIGFAFRLPVSMYYVNMSMFFSFATLYPDMQVLLYGILPLKVKWLAWFDAALFALDIIRALSMGAFAFALLPIIALLNYFIFFWEDMMDTIRGKTRRAAYRRSPQAVNFKKATRDIQQKKGYIHKCAVCGITDADDPNMEFRYCSKCNGYYCYCSKHINNHTHVQ